jgi:hypothetical protein
MSVNITATAAGAIHDLIFRLAGLKPMNANPIVVAKPCTAGSLAGGTWQIPDGGNAAQCDFRAGATAAVRNAGL